MKKTIAIGTQFENTRILYKNLLEDIIGDRFNIESYNFTYYSGPVLKPDVLLISTPFIINSARPYIHHKTKIIRIGRTFTHEAYQKLLSIPEKESYLLVNNGIDVTFETISFIYSLGFNFKLHPYYPGLEAPKDIKVAITTNEEHLVPETIEKVYNIDHMVYAVSTINEVLEYLEVEQEARDDMLYQYQKKVISTETGLHTLLDDYVIGKYEMQAMLNLIDEGVIQVDINGNISMMNESAEEILGHKKESLCDTPVLKLLGSYITSLDQEITDQLAEYNGEYLIINSKPTVIYNDTMGNIITLKKVTKLRKLEEQVRKDIAIKGHVARYRIEDILGNSPRIMSVKENARKIAGSDSSVLITGESGTGKELFAQAIHNESNRKKFPFIAINCAALPENLIESELFGYEKGAFTGASEHGKAGLFENAHLGTLFLDEIGDISLSLQAKLLRVLQEGEVVRIGGNKIRKVDVRILAATNRDLLSLAHKQQFRWDLYYRLNVFPLDILPLRDRKEDLPIIFRHYLKSFNCHKEISEALKETLLSYDWPGNIRELKNIVEYLALMGGNPLKPADLPKSFTQLLYKNENNDTADDLTCAILKILEERKKNRKKTGRNTLLILLEEQGWILTEREVRNKMENLQQQGYIFVGKGRQGSEVTEKGKSLLQESTD